MKTQIKRFSKSTLAIILSVCMLVSCLTVGIIATDAAVVSDSESVGGFASNHTIYFDNSLTNWSAVKLSVWQSGGSYAADYAATQISGTNYWQVQSKYGDSDKIAGFLFYDGTWKDDKSTQTEDSSENYASDWWNNCYTPESFTKNTGWSGSISKLVGTKDNSIINTTTAVTSGTGTSADPYIVPVGTKITVSASGTRIDSNHKVNIKFSVGNTSYASGSDAKYTRTNTVVSSAAAGTNYSVKATIKTMRGTGNSSKEVETDTLYYSVASATNHTVNFDNPLNGTITVKNGNATVNSGDQVAEGTKLTVTLKTNSGYELNSASGVDFGTGTGANDGITYTGTVMVNGDVAISATTKAITQKTVTLTTTKNISGYTVTYTKNRNRVSDAAYTDTITVDGGTDVIITAATKGRNEVDQWYVDGSAVSGATTATYTISNIIENKTAYATATKDDSVIYVKVSGTVAGGAVWYYTFKDGKDTGPQWRGTKFWTGSAVYSDATNVTYLKDDGSYKFFAIAGLTEGDSIIFNGQYNTSNRETASQIITYGNTYTVTSGENESWGISVQKMGDPMDETVIKVAKKSKDGTAVTGLYVWSYDGSNNQNILGKWEDTENNLTGSIASPAKKTDDGDYYVVTIPNSAFDNKTKEGKFWAILRLGDEQTEDTKASMEIGYTYILEAGNKGGDNKYAISVEEDTSGEVEYTITLNDNESANKTGAAAVSLVTSTAKKSITVTTYPKSGYAAEVEVLQGTTAIATTKSGDVYTFTMPAGNVTVNVSYVEKVNHSILARTNDSSLGTVTVDKATAQIGDTITVTLNAVGATSNYSNGSLKVTYSAGNTTKTVPVTEVAAGSTYKFIMPNYDVIVSADFTEYEEDANYWYDGYNAGHTKLTDYDTKRFTEVKYNGNLYAYYHVIRDDSTNDHVFTVKNAEDAGIVSTGEYVYWKVDINTNWNNNGKVKFYNGNSVISGYENWKDMNFVYQYNSEYKVWKALVPENATKVQFTTTAQNMAENYTGTIDLQSPGCYETKETQYTTNGSLTTLSLENMKNSAHDQTIHDNYTGSTSSSSSDGKVYVFGDNVYKKDKPYGSNLNIYNHNANSTDYAHTGHSKSDYYIIILYPNTNYGSLWDDATEANNNTADIQVIASTVLPGEEDPTVDYWAKDGVIRMAGMNTGCFGTTTVTAGNYVTVPATRSKFDEGSYKDSETWLEGTATKGKSITVTTTIADAYKAKYYVAGFDFNGVTPQVFSWREDGIYTCTYNIPSNFSGGKLEITPIYFLKDDTNTITFYIDGYNDAVEESWGKTLYVYPFYQYKNNGTVVPLQGQAENFRAYPGQPVINYGGRRYIQIPLTDNGKAIGTSGSYRIKGVTINNGFWDQVHGASNTHNDYGAGWEDRDTKGADLVNVHRQTYDYDDFYKIYNEYKVKGDKNLNSIYFTFKYRNTGEQHHNGYVDSNKTTVDQRGDTVTSLNYDNHTWELLKDNFGHAVDLFGTQLSDSQVASYADNEIYVVSEGYEANNAGKFATEWAVFKRTDSGFTRLTTSSTIVPSALVIANADDVSEAAYPTLDAADGDLPIAGYKSIYQALEDYRGQPVYICYEKELHGGSKSNGYDPAYRSDGRWTFTRTSDYIKGNVIIEYINEKAGVTDWTVDNFVTGTAVGEITGAGAYFTYVEGESGYAATNEGATSLSNLAIQNDKYFNFSAETAGSYEFMGWYSIDTNGDYHAVNNNDPYAVTGHSAMATDSTFVARFKYVSSGALTISHGLAAGNTGRGTTYLGVYVDGVHVADEASNTSAVKLDKTYISSNKLSKNITVVLRTVTNGENTFNAFSANKIDDNEASASISNGDTFFTGTNTAADGATSMSITFTVGDLYDATATQKVLALNYLSALNQPINSYLITYTYKDRFDTSKEFSVKGDFTAAELKAYVEGTGTGKTFKNTQFFIDKAPHESNFQTAIKWKTGNLTDIKMSGTGWTKNGENYQFTATVESETSQDLTRSAVFDVPYAIDENYKAVTDEGTAADYTKLADNEHETFNINTTYGELFKHNEQFITAAPSVKLNGDIVYFSYWQISTLTKSSKEGKKVAKCYYPEFNFVAYDNYYIKAVYSSSNPTGFADLGHSATILDTSISFLEDSRNQWNDKAKGQDADAAKDIIYNDFAMSFNYAGKQLNEYTGNNIKIGMVVERLGQIETSDGRHIGTLDSYETQYKSSEETIHSKLVSALSKGTWESETWKRTDSVNSYYAFNYQIAENGTSSFSADLLDNKNRTEFYFSLDNSQGQTGDLTALNTYNNKNYVYRAYSYIMVNENGTWKVAVSEKPAYFCMYDRAIK